RLSTNHDRSCGMAKEVRAEFLEMESLVQAADLPEESRHTLVWCLGQLPALFSKLCQTYESRYGDEIIRLERGMLKRLADKPAPSPDAKRVAETLAARL